MQQPHADGNTVATKLANRIAQLELSLAIAESTLEDAKAIIDAQRQTIEKLQGQPDAAEPGGA